MRKKIATLLRKWADRLDPKEAPLILSYEEYVLNTIQLMQIDNPEYMELPYYKNDMARKIGLKMAEIGAITFRSEFTLDGKLETLATAYVGIKK